MLKLFFFSIDWNLKKKYFNNDIQKKLKCLIFNKEVNLILNLTDSKNNSIKINTVTFTNYALNKIKKKQ